MSSLKKQRQRKNGISDALTMAMGKIGLFVMAVIIVIILPVYGLWSLAGTFEYAALRWLTVGFVMLLPAVFGLGFWFGKVEVRGFLGGFDRALDGLTKAVDLRDRSKVRMQQAAKAPPKSAPPDFDVYLPQAGAFPAITQRQLTQDEIVDL